MAELKPKPDCTIKLDGLAMDRRVFSYSGDLSANLALDGLAVVKDIIERDRALVSVSLRREEGGAHAVVVQASEPNHWVSCSPESPGLERQVHVLQELGNISSAPIEGSSGS